jgi:cation transporter-like permease
MKLRLSHLVLGVQAKVAISTIRVVVCWVDFVYISFRFDPDRYVYPVIRVAVCDVRCTVCHLF